jgi:hypothetical protein
MSAPRMTLVLGTAAGAFLAAGLTSLATSAVAQADDGDGVTIAYPAADVTLADPAAALTLADPAAAVTLADPAADPDFISATDKLLGLFGITDIGAADPDDNFEGMILNFPHLGITDVLTSGMDPSDSLAGLGVTLPDDVGVGMAGVTVNTFIDPSLGIDHSITIPFTDPLAGLWDFLVAHAFFGL